MFTLKEAYDNAWKSVIAPHKHVHCLQFHIGLSEFPDNVSVIEFTAKNNNGKLLSAFMMKNKNTSQKVSHLIFYMHGNGGSKIEAMNFSEIVSRCEDIAVISFDFIGCGNSDEGFLSYGVNEASDAQFVLRSSYKLIEFEKLTVWGRSMGAVTSILFAQKNHKIISRLVLDSPFRTLRETVLRVISQKTNFPAPLCQLLFYFLQEQVTDRLESNIFDTDYGKVLENIPNEMPVLFICGSNDTVVPMVETWKMFEKNCKSSQKDILEIDEGHEEDRPIEVLKTAVRWVKNLPAAVSKRKAKNNKLSILHKNPNHIFQRKGLDVLC